MNNEQTTFQTPSVTSKMPSGQAVTSFSTLTSNGGNMSALKPPTVNVPDTSGVQTYADMARQSILMAEAETQPLSQERASLIEQYKQQAGLMEGMAPDAQAIREAQGVTTNAKLVKDIADQIMAARTNTDIQKLQKGNLGGITTGMAQNIDQEAERNLAIKNLTLGTQLAAAQGNLALAEDNANRAIEAKYAPIEARINNLKSYLEMNKEELIRVDKKAYEKQTAMLNAKMKDVEEQKAGAEALQKMVITAASQGAPSSLITRAQGAKNAMEAAAILKEYAGDYYKTQLLKSQIQTEKAQQAKYYADIKNNAAKLASEMSIPVPQATAKVEAARDTQKLAEELLTLSGKGGAVGFGLKKTVFSKLPGIDAEPIAGTDRANYEAKFKQLKDSLAMTNLDKLKGAMSDKDIEFLRNTGTALSLDMSEQAFDIELNKVAEKMSAVTGIPMKSQQAQTPVSPFMQALGGADVKTQGASIIKQVSDNGNIEFAIPR